MTTMEMARQIASTNVRWTQTKLHAAFAGAECMTTMLMAMGLSIAMTLVPTIQRRMLLGRADVERLIRIVMAMEWWIAWTCVQMTLIKLWPGAAAAG
jgi:hypothetical protein